MKKHYPFGQFVNPLDGCTGKLPSASSIGLRSSKNYLHLANWRQMENVFSYSGPPEGSINGLNSDTYYYANFYVITWSPQTYASKKRYLTGLVQPWQIDNVNDKPLVKWYPDYTSGTNYTLWNATVDPNVYKSTYNDKSYAGLISLYGDNFNYTPVSNNGFQCSKLYMEDIQVAGIGITHVPIKPSEMHSANNAVDPANFVENQHIVGYDSGGSGFTNESLGALLYRVGPSKYSDGGHIDAIGGGEHYNASSVASRALVSWGHPVGVWINAGSDQTDVFGDFRFRFKPRNLFDSSGASAYVRAHYALVISGGDADTDFILDIAQEDGGSDTVTHHLAGALANPTLRTGISVTTAGDLDLQPDGVNTLRVRCTSPNAEVYLHTVALFEGVVEG